VAEVEPIRWRRGTLWLLDQRKLPGKEVYLEMRSAAAVAKAIRTMVVRGAPAIGVSAAFGLAVEAAKFRARDPHGDLEKAATVLASARPTAVNLMWAVERQRRIAREVLGTPPATGEAAVRRLHKALVAGARAMMAEDIAVNRSIGGHGARLVGRRGDVLTHCNAGALATAGYGTAIGVIRSAWESGRRFSVMATETRPYLQGARLTSWELHKLGIPVTLLTDGMVGHAMQRGRIGSVVVGTDRTAANGDVANKIGTYQIAVLARRHNVPFYVAAPTSSIDLECRSGAMIPIEERAPTEVSHVGGRRVATEGIGIFNPAFDVTPAELVSAIITEHGVVRGDYQRGLERVVRKAERTRR
jgi:methylthioribose-1-phosphate isomerase